MADLFFKMKWWLEDVEDAIKRATLKIAPVVDDVANELNIGKRDNLYVVGGFVRDAVLGGLTNRDYISKDLDLILPKRPNFDKNPNVLWKKENSLGGLKIGTKKFPEIDIFQESATNPQLIVGQFFDFNFNALYYSHYQKQIFASAYFYGFTSNKVINFENYIYTSDNIEQRYQNSWMISRALKFQIQFREKFGIETKLSPVILYMLYEMDDGAEQEMIDYTKIKVQSEVMRNKIINEYKRLKGY